MQERTLTYGDFARLAKRQGYTIRDLTTMVATWWEEANLVGFSDTPRGYAERVFSQEHARVVITYQSLIALYEGWEDPHRGEANTTGCACGCGKSVPVGTRKRYADGTCRVRHHRHTSQLKNTPLSRA
jgi:hypothetical protein